MNIRRFVANDMRGALAAVRADLGADAVMLSSRKLPNGVEVIAAIDYDEALLTQGSRETAANDDSDNRLADYAQVASARAPAPPAAAPAVEATADPTVAQEI